MQTIIGQNNLTGGAGQNPELLENADWSGNNLTGGAGQNPELSMKNWLEWEWTTTPDGTAIYGTVVFSSIFAPKILPGAGEPRPQWHPRRLPKVTSATEHPLCALSEVASVPDALIPVALHAPTPYMAVAPQRPQQKIKISRNPVKSEEIPKLQESRVTGHRSKVDKFAPILEFVEIPWNSQEIRKIVGSGFSAIIERWN